MLTLELIKGYEYVLSQSLAHYLTLIMTTSFVKSLVCK